MVFVGIFFSKRALKKEMASYFNLQNRNPQIICKNRNFQPVILVFGGY